MQVHMAQIGGHRANPIQGGRLGNPAIGVPHIQAQTQTGVLHLPDNFHQHLRPRLHHVFHREEQIIRRVGQEFLPEVYRL